MDKNNNSQLIQEKLLYLPPSYEEKQKGRQMVQEKGFTRSFSGILWPVIKENPFPFIGISMMIGCLVGSFYFEVKKQREKAFKMLHYKGVIGLLTVASFAGGLYYRDYKTKKYGREHEKSEAEE